ncbi:MAG: antitoxin, partial [Mesorhizobium sp.]
MALEKTAPAAKNNELQKVARLLGGSRILARRLSSALDAHE